VNPQKIVTDLRKCQDIVGKLCSESRPPKMSIPVRDTDEDMFIFKTINDAIELIRSLSGPKLDSKDSIDRALMNIGEFR